MRFSSRVDISELNPIAKAEATAKTAGRPLGKLNDSNPTRHALAPDLVPDIYSADPRGQRYAREALAAFLDMQEIGHCSPDDLYILSSTSEAYSWLIKLLCDAGDAVLAPKPGYPLIESIARLECVDMIEYQQRFDGSWYIDVAELKTALEGPDGNRIRALVLINPNNPDRFVRQTVGTRGDRPPVPGPRRGHHRRRSVLRLRFGTIRRQYTTRGGAWRAHIRVGRFFENARRNRMPKSAGSKCPDRQKT